jgi:hypothetical protein
MKMHLLIDGYNLLHVNRSLSSLNSMELQRERDRLIDELSAYRQRKPCDITIVFDGWQGGWTVEKKEKRRGIEIVFSRLGEKADEVIKRLIRERGSGTVLISSDRELIHYAGRMSVSAIPSDRFQDRIERSVLDPERGKDEGKEEEERGGKRKGPSRRPSKKEKRARAALKKL